MLVASVVATVAVACGSTAPREAAHPGAVEGPAAIAPDSTLPGAEGQISTSPSAEAASSRVVVTPNGLPVPAIAPEGVGWKVITPCGRTADTPAKPIEAVDVVLDPGHGGSESGAVGPNGLTEKDLNLRVSLHAAAALEAAGYKVLLTRTGDYRMTLASRGQLTLASGARAFVSVHHNAGYSQPWAGPGSEMYHQVAVPESQRLGGLLYEEIVTTLSRYEGISWVAGHNPGVKTRLNDAGHDYYGMVRRTRGVPGVLAELAFISNGPEADLLARPDVAKAEGEAVARGVIRFLRTSDPGSGFVERPAPVLQPAGGGGGAEGCVDPPL